MSIFKIIRIYTPLNNMRYYSFSFIIISSKAMIATIVQNVKIIFVKNILIIINTQFICQKDLFIAQTKILDCF